MGTENKKSQAALSSKKMSKPSLLRMVFFTVFNIILLTLLSWFLLIIWFSIHISFANLNMAIKCIVTVVSESTKITFLKFYIFISYLPFMAVMLFIFVVDGLVQRDIRKFQCARESTLFFHRLKLLPNVSFYFIYFIYMVIPLKINAELFLVPMICVSGFFTTLAIKYFKKHV